MAGTGVAFDERQHPRGQPGNPGQFREKPAPADPLMDDGSVIGFRCAVPHLVQALRKTAAGIKKTKDATETDLAVTFHADSGGVTAVTGGHPAAGRTLLAASVAGAEILAPGSVSVQHRQLLTFAKGLGKDVSAVVAEEDGEMTVETDEQRSRSRDFETSWIDETAHRLPAVKGSVTDAAHMRTVLAGTAAIAGGGKSGSRPTGTDQVLVRGAANGTAFTSMDTHRLTEHRVAGLHLLDPGDHVLLPPEMLRKAAAAIRPDADPSVEFGIAGSVAMIASNGLIVYGKAARGADARFPNSDKVLATAQEQGTVVVDKAAVADAVKSAADVCWPVDGVLPVMLAVSPPAITVAALTTDPAGTPGRTGIETWALPAAASGEPSGTPVGRAVFDSRFLADALAAVPGAEIRLCLPQAGDANGHLTGPWKLQSGDGLSTALVMPRRIDGDLWERAADARRAAA